jgi:hypothetical protein
MRLFARSYDTCVATVCRLADDDKIGMALEQHTQAAAHNGMVVNDQDADVSG